MEYCELEVSAVQADFGDISEVKEVAVVIQERRKNRMGDIERALYLLGACFQALSR